MQLCDFYKIHSFLADLLYSNIDLSSSGHKLTKFHDLVKKNEVEKNSHFSHFFSNSAVSWLWGTPTVTKLKTKGPHGQKHVLSCSKNSTRKFQLVCWNFDFCILGRFLQIQPSVRESTICDPRGPPQGPKVTRNAPKITTFSFVHVQRG